jgi:hypothetical protein
MGIITSSIRETQTLPQGMVLVCVTAIGGGARVWGYPDTVAEGQSGTLLATLSSNTSTNFGPYRSSQRFTVECTSGVCAVSTAEADAGLSQGVGLGEGTGPGYVWLQSATFVNIGTALAPVYELQAIVVPRTDTLANLKTLNSGSGELSSATDVAAIVQLNGASGSGTTSVYSPMAPGVWTDSTFTLTPPISTGAGSTLVIKGGATSAGAFGFGGGISFSCGGGTTGGSGGSMFFTGGTGGSSGLGGSLNFVGGAGAGGGGALLLKPGNSSSGASSAGTMFLSTADGTNVITIGPLYGTLSFYNGTPVTKPVITGSKTSGAALTSLLAALSSLNLADTTGVTA